MIRGDSLSPLFAPRSVAVVGASARPGRPGRQVLEALRRADPDLPVHPITPRYDEILGLACHPDLQHAPKVDLVVIASAAERIERDVEAAIESGARSLVILGAPHADRARWLTRLGDRARDAGIPLLGPDTLGFANLVDGIAATWAMPEVPSGGIALISQSGTTYWEANTIDPRLGFAFTVHTGLEATLTIADAMAYALELEATRVIGIYVETIRDPDGFTAALRAAAERDVPVVALYAGRTSRALAQMTTHAGRLAGDAAALEGVFRAHGVARTVTPDEWWTTIALLGADRRIGSGGLAAVMDSGGGLAMFLDYAEELGIPMAELSPQTKRAAADLLAVDDVESSAIDFWVGEVDRHASTEDLLVTLAADEQTAAVLAFTTYAEPRSAGFAEHIAQACRGAADRSPKSIVSSTYTSRQLHPELMLELTRAGIPTLDGMRNALLAFRHAFKRRDHRELHRGQLEAAAPELGLVPELIEKWRERLRSEPTLMEADALRFLADFGVPTVPVRQVSDAPSALAAASELGYPVTMKTDEGIAHKGARGGVRLGLSDECAVARAYNELAEQLGPRVLVAPMISGIEAALGVVVAQFGALVVVGAGGGLIELLTDRCYVLGPASPADLEEAMSDLALTRVLRGAAGVGEGALTELCELASRLSVIGATFADQVTEIDINPVMVGAGGCVAVDALVGTAMDGGQH